MLKVIRVPRSNGKNRANYSKPVFQFVNPAPEAPKVTERKNNQPMSRRLAKKRGLYDPVYVDVPWTYK